MALPTPQIEFQFVNSTLSSPKVPQDLAVRALIRKQAMKKASAARKRDGNYGKHNLRQYPVFVFNQENVVREPTAVALRQVGYGVHNALRLKDGTNTRDRDTRSAQYKNERTTVERQRWLATVSLNESLSAGMSAKGYEGTRVKSDFDILDLSTLATLHVGRATRSALSQNPVHLIHQLRSNYDPQWSFLAFLPSRYDEIQCLSDATNCIISRARQILYPDNNWEAAVITFYVKALYSLQRALDSPAQCFRPEVLCATEILALYELLDPSGETAWVRHTAGAARLIQLRGPKSYNTEFEKALFMAHTVPFNLEFGNIVLNKLALTLNLYICLLMTECLLNNEHCFLEQKAWQKVFVSAIKETPTITDRSEIVVSLLMMKCFIPGFFAEVTKIICNDGNREALDPKTIASQLRQLRANLLKWHGRYESILQQTTHIPPGSAEYDSHCKVFATYLSCLIISSRLLGALCGEERVELESVAQGLGEQMFDLELEVKNTSMQTSLFMAQTLGVAQATKATTEYWTQMDGDESGLGQQRVGLEGVIARWRFEGWCRLCGRKLPSDLY